MRFPRSLATVVCLGALASCGGNEEREETWTVQSNQAVCSGVFAQFCYVVQKPNDSRWQYEYVGIQGFQYEWGHTYSLKVGIESLDSSGEDAPPYALHLRQVLSNTAVAPETTFQLYVQPAEFDLARSAPDRFMVVGRKELVCQAADCAAIDDLIAQGLSAVLEFDHANSPGGPLHLLRIACAADAAHFDADCLH